MARFPLSRFWLIAALTLTAVPARYVDAEPRTWKDSTGKFSVEAEFAGIIAGEVRLRKVDGTAVSVPLDRLSQADRDWLEHRNDEPKEAESIFMQSDEDRKPDPSATEAPNVRESEVTKSPTPIELPDDWTGLWLEKIGVGELAVAVNSPIAYRIPDGEFLKLKVWHAFLDGSKIQDETVGFYEVAGSAAEIQIRGPIAKPDGKAAEYVVVFAGKELRIPLVLASTPDVLGHSARELIEAFGLPDSRETILVGWPDSKEADGITYSPRPGRSVSVEHWRYDMWPRLTLVLEAGEVDRFVVHDPSGLNAYVKWRIKHGDR